MTVANSQGELWRLRHCATLTPKPRHPINDAEIVSFLPMEAIGEDGAVCLDSEVSAGEAKSGYTYFEDQDIVIAKITPCFENGKGALVRNLKGGKGFGTTELHVLRPKPNLDARFLWWVTASPSFRDQGTATMLGAGGQKRVTPEFVLDYRIELPALQIQRKIADYLDRETAQIDALINEKERLLKLLDERRQAIVTEAVTRGLNPTVPMKESGHPWLGRIPANWSLKPVKHLAKVGNGSTPNRDNSEFWSGGDFPWLNSSVVNQDEVSQADQYVTAIALRECHLPIIDPPAVLVGITGQGRTRGMATTLRFRSTINQHIAYVKPIDGICDVDFLRHVFDVAYRYLRDQSDGAGSTKGAITCEQIADLRVPLPKMSEQLEIADRLRQVQKSTVQLIACVESQFARLKERRAVLINEVVTGQMAIGGQP